MIWKIDNDMKTRDSFKGLSDPQIFGPLVLSHWDSDPDKTMPGIDVQRCVSMLQIQSNKKPQADTITMFSCFSSANALSAIMAFAEY